MNSLFQILPFFYLILSHPLECVDTTSNTVPSYTYVFVDNKTYYTPDDGIVKEVSNVNGLYQTTLSLNAGGEIIYSGLTEIYIHSGVAVRKGEAIGKDKGISSNTKYIAIFYKDSNLFPQFENNELIFFIDSYSKVYAPTAMKLARQGFDQETYEAGYYAEYRILHSDINVIFKHLSALPNIKYDSLVKKGDIIAYSGNTGNSKIPQLKICFKGLAIDDDIRVIYLKE